MDSRYAVPAPPGVPSMATAAPAPSTSETAHTPGIGLGIGLIVFGVAALFVRLAPEVSWASAWPLVFIVIGFVQMITPSRTFGWSADRVAEGFGTMLFGGVLLGCTTGYVEWSMWITLLSLWPLLLVVAGLHLLAEGSRLKWLRAGAYVLVWGALLFAAAGAWTGGSGMQPLPREFVNAVTTSPDAVAEQFADTVVKTIVGPLTASER